MPRKKKELLTCANCGGGVEFVHDESGAWFRCPRCEVRVAGPFTDAKDIPEYKPARVSRSR